MKMHMKIYSRLTKSLTMRVDKRQLKIKRWVSLVAIGIIIVFSTLNPVPFLEYRVQDFIFQNFHDINSIIATSVTDFVSICIVIAIMLLGMLFGEFFNARVSIVVYLLIGLGYFVIANYFFGQGYILPILLPLTVLGLTGMYQFVYNQILHRIERNRVRGSFRKYLDPKLADALIADQNVDTEAIGKKRQIAVLFVDVRGFTQMAEALKETPELVVEILNDYLELTTNAVFNNGGSVDKFIGDATMALFNGFMPQEDYIYHAVKAAWEMVEGAEAITKPVRERLGINLAYGIGVHCGEAIVGNLGPAFRKDYTAIGDMVNIASRLESNADRSEILISKDVYDALKGRIKAEEIGEMLLKGKTESLEVFTLKGFV